MRPGVRLGIDVGKARIGVARCDPGGLLATPVETVPRDPAGIRDLQRLRELATEHRAIECVVGLPIALGGHRTPSTDDAEGFAEQLAASNAGFSVRLIDERLSTTQAQGHLRATGKKTKQTRGVIDQAAAVVILQHALDAERLSGREPGRVVVGEAETRSDAVGTMEDEGASA